MINQIYINNFKIFKKETIPIEKHNIIIGENDAGKSSILQALDIFFNQEKVEKSYVRNLTETVEIGILVDNKFYKKTYTPPSFKMNSTTENISDLDFLRYVYIPVSSYDVKQIITQLAIAKTLGNTDPTIISKIKEISQNSIQEVIDGIDNDLLIINNEETKILGEENFKYEMAIKFNILSNGISIDSRGSGFQKNLMYALLVGSDYSNVILGIDEIENSFSVNNSKNMIEKIQSKIGQTLITTHSKKIIEVANNSNIIPLFSHENKTLIEMLNSLDNTDSRKYLLVEGKFDLPWFKKSIELLGKSSEYIVLPGGGENNIDILKAELELLGKKCVIIKDGDTNQKNSLSKDCIELYTPLLSLNEVLNLELEEVPNTKDVFFEKTIIDGERNEDTVKRILANNAKNFLKIDNELIAEVQSLLNENS